MKSAAKILLIAFVLNFFWEIGQVGLYAPHFEGAAGLARVHLWASFGDLFLTLFILSLNQAVFKRIFPGKELNRKRIAAMMCAGFAVAVLIEKFALESGRWSYSVLMPVIPFLGIGLMPVLQMTFIPVLALFLGSIKRRD